MTEGKLDALLEQLSKAVYKENQKKVEKLRPQIVEAVNAFQKEQEVNKMIRYYKGIVKIERISDMTPMKTALYDVLEDGLHLKKGSQICAPVRLCWREKKK